MSWSVHLFRFGVILLFTFSVIVVGFSIVSLATDQSFRSPVRQPLHAGTPQSAQNLQSIIRSNADALKARKLSNIQSLTTLTAVSANQLDPQSKNVATSSTQSPTSSSQSSDPLSTAVSPEPSLPSSSLLNDHSPLEFKTVNQVIHEHIKDAKPKAWRPPKPNRTPPTVDQLVAHAISLYPNLLTQHPSIDCQIGRYLVVDTWYPDGLGSSLTSYASLLQHAIDFNFTIVGFPFEASHYDTKNRTLIEEIKLDRASKLDYLIGRWHVPRSDWDACPMDSPVKVNNLFLKSIEFDQFTFAEPRGEHASAITGVPASLTNIFVRSYNVDPSKGQTAIGYTQRIGRWWGYRGCMRRVSLIFAVRRHLTMSPTLPPVLLVGNKPHNGETSTTPAVDLSPTLNVGVHVRQGDRGFYNATTDQFMVRARYREWVLSTGVWRDMLTLFLEAVPEDLKPKLRFTVYSEVDDGDVSKLHRYISPLLDWPLVYSINLLAIDSMLDMANKQHIFIGSPSDFSRSVCQTNVDVLKLANHRSMQFRHHSCHNTWLYTVDYSDIHPESPEVLLDENQLNGFQKLHAVHDGKKRELTEQIRAAAARASGEIIPAMYEDDFEMVHTYAAKLRGIQSLVFD